MAEGFSDAELEAYLDEGLDPDRAAQLEQAAREDSSLIRRLSHINSRRDAGIHTLGEIWRRNQIGVPTREEMGNYLLGALPAERAEYVRFRLETIKCPYTIALLTDLKQLQQQPEKDHSESRRKKYFHSSAGLLKPKE